MISPRGEARGAPRPWRRCGPALARLTRMGTAAGPWAIGAGGSRQTAYYARFGASGAGRVA
jgi:hypothetical protein